MNIGSLLRRIDAELGGPHRRWSDVLVMKNVGPLACAQVVEGDAISNRGFNAFLLDFDHKPTHFLKVRPAAHEDFRREAAMAVHLATTERSRSLVPAARSFVESSVRLLLQDYVPGPLLEIEVRRSRDPGWYGLAADALGVVGPLWEAIPQAVDIDIPPAIDVEGLLGCFRTLESLGLESGPAQFLADRIARSRLRPRPQHGDLWPRNVIRSGNGWRVLDFETCGAVMIPLYDVFHLIRGCGEAAGGGHGDWLGRWLTAGPSADVLAKAVLDFAQGMDIREIEAALVAYSVDFCARLHRRGVARDRVAALVQELRLTARAIRSGSVAKLVLDQDRSH